MIARSYILATLKTLDYKFKQASSAKESLFYSKLAIMELCGWIEESMDDVILRCASRELKDKSNIDYLKEKIVESNYGFDYQNNFRKMLVQLLGLVQVEKIEKKIDEPKRLKLKSTLGTLKVARNTEAHTHIKGVTRHINAPSVTLGQFTAVYEGLIEIDTFLRTTKF